jgi:WD40 repeat protein
LSPDGSKVAVGWESLSLLDAITGRTIQPALRPNLTGRGRKLTEHLWFSHDGRWLWEATRGRCQRYEVSSGQAAGEPLSGSPGVYSPLVSRSGRRFVLYRNGGIELINTDTGELVGPAIRLEDTVTTKKAADLSPDGQLLATTGPDRVVRVWNTLTGQQVGETFVQPSQAASVSFSPDGQWLTIVTKEGPARMHRLAAQASTTVQEWSGAHILGFNSQGHLLTHTASNQMMQWLDPGTGRLDRLGISRARTCDQLCLQSGRKDVGDPHRSRQESIRASFLG